MQKITLVILLILVSCALLADTVFVQPQTHSPLSINVLDSNDDQTILELNFSSFDKNTVNIQGNEYNHITLGKEGLILEEGQPQLPFIGRSIIIPDNGKMTISVMSSNYTDFSLAVAPSKGSLLRNVNPDDVPYTFADTYQKNEFYPSNIASLGDPYIMRDFRGIVVGFKPFQYNPVTQTLRVYHNIKVKVSKIGIDDVNVLNRTRSSVNRDFSAVYNNHFLNYQTNADRYTPILEDGTLLVITHPMFTDAIQPYLNWKKQKGINTTLVTTTETGTTANAIKTYIQNYYTANPDLAYIQLVGDAAQVPTLTNGGGGSDPSYVMLLGNDNYPELFIGRFSAETVAQAETQVLRSIWYERDITVEDGTWIKKATGIASSEGGGGQGDMGESDIAHQNLIRTDLLNYGYTSVDQAYAPSITATTLSNNFNEGRGFINYTGHGDVTYWVTSNFSNTHVNALTNDYKLPFIVSVACVNGNFTSTTCFGEAWLRATNETTGAPNGAVVAYMSTVNQPWNEPMRGQDVITDLMVAHDKFTIGGLFFNGSSAMLDAYNNNASSVLTMKTWIIFGDASLVVRNDTPQLQTVNSMDNLFIGLNTYEVTTNVPNALACLFNPETNEILGSAYTDETGHVTLNITPMTAPATIKLTVTAPNAVTFVKDVMVIPNDGAYIVYNEATVTLTGNNSLDYNSISPVNISITNVGNIPANNLTVTLRSLNPYITVTDSVATVAQIPSETLFAINEVFSIQSAANCPDATNAPMQIIITDDQQNTWISNFNLLLNAPVIEFGEMTINDTQANNNGRLDPGETILLSIPVQNTGHALSENGDVSYASTNPLVTILNSSTEVNSINPQATTIVDLMITADPSAPMGSIANIGLFAHFGSIVNQSSLVLPVGLKIESFETGNFASYPWIPNATNPWTVVNTGAFDGTYAAKSGPISHSANTSISIVDTASTAGYIKFAVKASSESGYDFLKFYVDNVEKGSWSGEVEWTEVQYPVTAGAHTYKWTYNKDNIVSSGSDCAWIDKVVFPAAGGSPVDAPIAFINSETLAFGSIEENDTMTKEIVLVNFGTQSLTGSITVPNGFFINSENLSTLDYTIPANSNQSFNITFAPTAEGNYDGQLTITSNDINHANIVIDLTAACQNVSTEPISPKVTKLYNNYPNPFNPTTNIAFSLKEQANVSIDIFNVKGQLVKRLINGQMPAGNHTITWTGKDENQKQVSSGVYFYRMQTNNYTTTKKMLMMK